MSRQENPDYFGKSAFSPLEGVADAARKVMMGETQEETEEVPEDTQAETPKKTEPQKLNEESKNG
jgi:hypothetical protein|tara:strand:- start:115 stop:309 length:195 start_codon:yes stop_codon:yes gene_type:complete